MTVTVGTIFAIMNGVMNQMNQILRVFSTINRLFCEVRWLERNLRNSNSTVMIIVGGIIIFCLYTASVDSSGGNFLPPGVNKLLMDWGPFVIIALVAGLFLYRRSVSGPMGGSGSINEVMFGGNNGNNDNGGEEEQSSRQQHPNHSSYHQNQSSHSQASPPQAVPIYNHPSNTATIHTTSPSAPPKQATVHAEAVQYV